MELGTYPELVIFMGCGITSMPFLLTYEAEVLRSDPFVKFQIWNGNNRPGSARDAVDRQARRVHSRLHEAVGSERRVQRELAHRCAHPIAQTTDKIEFVATEHFWASGMYWGLTALHVLGRMQELDERAILEWVLSCRHANGGFGGSPRNDPHLLYTLSAVQIMALFDRLDLLDAAAITKCERGGALRSGGILILCSAHRRVGAATARRLVRRR